MDAAWIGVVASLGGVVIGGLLGFADSELRWRREQRAAELEDANRRDAEIRTVCIQIAALAEQVGSRAWSFVDYRLQDPKGWRADPYVQAQQDALEESIAQFDVAMNTLRVLRRGGFVDAAEDVDDLVRSAVDRAFGEQPEHPDPVGTSTIAFLRRVAEELPPAGPTSTRGIAERPYPRRLRLPR